MATVGPFSKPRLHAAASLGQHPQLLPHQSTLRSGGSHQRQHQNPSQKGAWLQESGLSAVQGSAHGGHQDRIPRSSESSLKCGSRRILVQSRIFEQREIPALYTGSEKPAPWRIARVDLTSRDLRKSALSNHCPEVCGALAFGLATKSG